MKYGPEYMLFAGEPSCTHSVSIEASYWELAKQLGSGNASKGIRRALYKSTHSISDEFVCEENTRSINKL